MTGFDALEGQLLDAIERKESRRSRHGALLIVVASSAVVVAVVALAIVALGHRKPPPSHPVVAAASARHHDRSGRTEQAKQPSVSVTAPMHAIEIGKAPRGPISPVYVALSAVQNDDPDCRPFHVGGAGTPVSEGTPSAYMLSLLGVLRRPGTPADRLPAPFNRPGKLLPPIGFARQVYIRYVRLARVVNGISYYIVPAAQVGPIAPPASVLNRCYSEEIQALKSRLRNASASVRASTLNVGARVFAQVRANGAVRRAAEGVVVLEWQPGGGGGGPGSSAQTIARQGSLGIDNSAIYGVVPSGVAKVTVEWPAGGKGQNRQPPESTTADVVNNMFVVKAYPVGRAQFPGEMIWRAASGRVIRVVTNLS